MKGHLAQFPVKERPCDQQAVAKISIGPRCMLQMALMFDFRSEERMGSDVLIRSIRAKLRRHEALDASRERGFEKVVLCLNCGGYMAQARYYGVLVLEDFTQSIVVLVVHFYNVDCARDWSCLSTASERLHAEAGCIEGMDYCWSDGTCYLWMVGKERRLDNRWSYSCDGHFLDRARHHR